MVKSYWESEWLGDRAWLVLIAAPAGLCVGLAVVSGEGGGVWWPWLAMGVVWASVVGWFWLRRSRRRT